MAQAGVGAISLDAAVARFDSRAGNSVLYGGSYTTTAGQPREAIAVAFTTDQVNTRFVLPVGFAYDPEVFTLPNLRGYGQLPDLWVAANDNSDDKLILLHNYY
jgi:hypothetical protein